MKTYCQTKSRSKIDWNKTLDDLIAGKNTTRRISDIKELSNKWVTCACGNQCDVLPRWDDGSPKDTELEDLGMEFCDNIFDENWKAARTTLNKIEKRSTLLINEIRKDLLREQKEINKKLAKLS